MKFEQERATLFGENLIHFAQYVRNSENINNLSDHHKLFRLKNIIEEYRIQLLGEEIVRLNQFNWQKEQSELLIFRACKALENIAEYVENNLDDLFIYSARIHILKHFYESFHFTN
ncbi:hypothetical protein J27TS8_18930 [Robertmurraya siralis]|uniref:Uncharacterized protein n=1 Tax=Robertmurraya siralis TaxID=77777 RepID=A0A919WH99_9BACI|nr:hypothetical protein [Robertmurraya siralis]PAE19157.1 hypothetical protein CHH80_17965 [Bacillus sp. 7504-2]GIN61900.1 hypothetical protein J27TS8_18930 [Robertmurraya siralis]